MGQPAHGPPDPTAHSPASTRSRDHSRPRLSRRRQRSDHHPRGEDRPRHFHRAGTRLRRDGCTAAEGGAVAVLRDLTETERVEKTRRDFIANVSHELRTPLTSIQGYAETLLDSISETSGSTREFLEIIRKNAARMSRLTEDLLTLARVESG